MTTFKLLLFPVLLGHCASYAQGQDSSLAKERIECDCLLSSIAAGDTLVINVQSRGCEHFRSERVTIYYHLDTLRAVLILPKSFNAKIHSDTRAMDELSIEAYRKFESQGKSFVPSDQWCTNHDEYEIILKDDVIRFVDEGCEFEAYRELTQSIFGQDQIRKMFRELHR